MTILTTTNLETTEYKTPEWVAIYNANIYKLNELLLKINALQDVDPDGIVHGSVLKWKNSENKWEAYKA